MTYTTQQHRVCRQSILHTSLDLIVCAQVLCTVSVHITQWTVHPLFCYPYRGLHQRAPPSPTQHWVRTLNHQVTLHWLVDCVKSVNVWVCLRVQKSPSWCVENGTTVTQCRAVWQGKHVQRWGKKCNVKAFVPSGLMKNLTWSRSDENCPSCVCPSPGLV